MIQSMKAGSGRFLLVAALLSISSALAGCIGEDPSDSTDAAADRADSVATEDIQGGDLTAAETPAAKAVGTADSKVTKAALQAPVNQLAPAPTDGDPDSTPAAGQQQEVQDTPGGDSKGGKKEDPQPCPWSQKNYTTT